VVTAVAIVSLALGIGASTTIFTLFDKLLLAPLPVDRPHQLRTTESVLRIGERLAKSTNTVPYRMFQSLQEDDSIFSETLAFSAVAEPVVTDGTRSLHSPNGGLLVSSNYFSMLGLRAQIGRLFQPADGPSIDQGVVLADRFWRNELAGDAQVVGRSLRIDGVSRTVLGVAPREFFGLTVGRAPDFYMPIVPMAALGPGPGVQIVGRLSPGLQDTEAAERLTAFTRAHGAFKPDQPQPRVQVWSLETGLSTARGQFLKPLLMLMAMVILLLIVACANVATLLLSRGSSRRVEMSIRSAIGAGHARLIRQLATEGAVLVASGALLGIVLASWGTGAFLRVMQFVDATLAVDVALDFRVLVFTAAACAVAVLLAAVIPAIVVGRAASVTLVTDRNPRTASNRRLGPFIVVQVAVSLTLVVAAGLLMRTLQGLGTVDVGFNPDRVALVSVVPGARGYLGARLAAYYEQLSDRLRQLPGVSGASLAQFSFLTESSTSGTVDVPGYSPATDGDRWVQVYQVGAQFFSTMGIPILEGHDFTDADLSATPRAIAISASAARRYFGESSAIGRAVYGDQRQEFQVIAVVADGRYNTLRDRNGAIVFVPYAVRLRDRMTYAVRLAGPGGTNDAAMLERVLSEARALDPLVPIRVETLNAVVERSLGQERLLAVITTSFAVTALILLALGLYGVIGFSVTERTEEIGVRLALGARPTAVAWTILRRPFVLVLIGIGLGGALAQAGARLVSGILYGLGPSDPLTLGAAITFMIGVAVVAAAVPTRRATQVDPLRALRSL
jgi:predicted permease